LKISKDENKPKKQVAAAAAYPARRPGFRYQRIPTGHWSQLVNELIAVVLVAIRLCNATQQVRHVSASIGVQIRFLLQNENAIRNQISIAEFLGINTCCFSRIFGSHS
jgi:hypothetical protein